MKARYAVSTILLTAVIVGTSLALLPSASHEGPTTYHIEREPGLPPGATEAHVLVLNATVFDMLPIAARDALQRAVEDGRAEMRLEPEEATALWETIARARKEQGRPEAYHYSLRGELLRIGVRISDGSSG